MRGGIQTSPILYALDRRGAQLLQGEFGYSEADLRYSREKDQSLQFIEHTLGLGEVRIAVLLACQRHRLELKHWRDEKALKASYDTVSIGPRPQAVLPDAYFVLQRPHGGEYHFFVEYDRGVENLKFFKKKMAAYVVYLTSSLCRRRYGTTQIRVLVVSEGGSAVTHRSRGGHLKETTEAAGGRQHFYFAVMSAITAHDILTDPIWQIAGASAPATLLPTEPLHQPA